MFPTRHDVPGYHSVRSSARSPKEEGRRYAQVWFRSVVFFGVVGVAGLVDIFTGMSSEAYFACMALTLFPIIVSVTA